MKPSEILEHKLLLRLVADCAESERIGYRPSYFRRMIAECGAKGACIQVIMARRLPEGFSKLCELGRLDLTAERAVLDGEWRGLFGPAVLQMARRRLRQFGRADLIP